MADIAVLNRGHRERQAQNALEVQRMVAKLFAQMVDPTNIAGTAQQWMVESIAAILKGRRTAYLLASAYATAIRRIQAPDAPRFDIPRPPDPPMAQLVRSLTYTGPGKLAVDLAKIPQPSEPPASAPHFEWDQHDRDLRDYEKRLKEAPAKAALFSSAAAYRHVADGGRDTIDTVVTQDPVAVGWVRITRPGCCSFCAMLASRGPTYSKQSFDRSDARFEGPGEHKTHDSCGCMMQPIYGGTSVKHWPDASREFERLWLASGAKYSGDRARLEFRQAYEGRGKYGGRDMRVVQEDQATG